MQKRPVISQSLLIVATPYVFHDLFHDDPHTCNQNRLKIMHYVVHLKLAYLHFLSIFRRHLGSGDEFWKLKLFCGCFYRMMLPDNYINEHLCLLDNKLNLTLQGAAYTLSAYACSPPNPYIGPFKFSSWPSVST